MDYRKLTTDQLKRQLQALTDRLDWLWAQRTTASSAQGDKLWYEQIIACENEHDKVAFALFVRLPKAKKTAAFE